MVLLFVSSVDSQIVGALVIEISNKMIKKYINSSKTSDSITQMTQCLHPSPGVLSMSKVRSINSGNSYIQKILRLVMDVFAYS